MSDQRRGDSALVGKVFVFTKGGVRDIGPSPSISDKGILGASHYTRPHAQRPAVPGLHRWPDLFLQLIRLHRLVLTVPVLGCIPPITLGTAAVVLKIKEQGIFKFILIAKFFDHPTNPLIHIVDHRSVSFHIPDFPLLVRSLFPIIGTGG